VSITVATSFKLSAMARRTCSSSDNECESSAEAELCTSQFARDFLFLAAFPLSPESAATVAFFDVGLSPWAVLKNCNILPPGRFLLSAGLLCEDEEDDVLRNDE